MIEIKAGPELDSAVAEAIGWIKRENTWHSPERAEYPVLEFKPSADLNAAFAAAEKVELFHGMWLGRLVTGWTIMTLDTQDVVGPEKGCYTPAIAICTAILHVKGYDFTHGDLTAMGGLAPT